MATLTDPENDMTNQTNTALSSGARLYIFSGAIVVVIIW
jgi:hypothetical protein